MIKKLLLSLGALALIALSVPLVAGFEAHVVNVTAHIANALVVTPDSREFGTVFPQEYMEMGVTLSFSESFLDEEQTHADTVEYIIKQKPKPKPEPDRQLPILKPDYNMYLPGGQFDGQLYPHFINDDLQRSQYCHSHQPADLGNPDDLYYINCYPSLCPYLSKTPDDLPEPGIDIGVAPFHDPNDPDNYAWGILSKGVKIQDLVDEWTIDLAVPCFTGQCAQDWADFVASHNPNADASQYSLPGTLEHQVFGCDLWFEVTDIYGGT
ncbi:MAG: hypothetical protein ABIJ81_00575 [Patescibacteria group bacterium]